ncbi:phage tail assembly chaperone [Duganella callida]|uniref:Uncharacterized protein n=1 Tax=Duganella callida TaxID=2561932 RepID=A0A4Y9S470_9BURK|nr:hypothetical protein [Duganella callida]TFW15971.1 hypothetical protein E4L98_25085 [Duganella callida]
MAPDPPRCPYELTDLWEWFTTLNRRRQAGMALNPLSSDEVLKWCARQRLSLSPYEHTLIDRLDDLYLSYQNQKESA